MKVQLEWRKGQPVLTGCDVDYVGGQLKKAWEEAFLAHGLHGRSWKRVLLIGMGASLIQILSQTGQPPPAEVLILEKDPQMVALQETYFDLPLPYRVVLGDAVETIHEVGEFFDGIFVDVFVEREVPEGFLQGVFVEALHRRLEKKGVVVWNVLLPKQAKQVENWLRTAWPVVRVRRLGAHHFFLAGAQDAEGGWPF
jgi:spermidine synthase